MPITVQRIGDKYEAHVTPSDHDEPWRSPHPMSHGGLIAALLEEGCHPTDVADAMHESDREWECRNPPTLSVDLQFWEGDPGEVVADKKWEIGDLKALTATIRHKHGGWQLTSDADQTASFERASGTDLRTSLGDEAGPGEAAGDERHVVGRGPLPMGSTPELWISAPILAALADLGASLAESASGPAAVGAGGRWSCGDTSRCYVTSLRRIRAASTPATRPISAPTATTDTMVAAT